MWSRRSEPERLRQYQATLTAAIKYVRARRLVVHVVLPREPGLPSGPGKRRSKPESG